MARKNEKETLNYSAEIRRLRERGPDELDRYYARVAERQAF